LSKRTGDHAITKAYVTITDHAWKDKHTKMSRR
jgi:hypothetical protein